MIDLKLSAELSTRRTGHTSVLRKSVYLGKNTMHVKFIEQYCRSQFSIAFGAGEIARLPKVYNVPKYIIGILV